MARQDLWIFVREEEYEGDECQWLGEGQKDLRKLNGERLNVCKAGERGKTREQARRG